MKRHEGWMAAGSVVGLCCAGSPLLLAFLGGIGLGFVINDFILFPLFFLSIGFMFYALHWNKKMHVSKNPLYLAIVSTILILVGIFVKPIIWIGIAGLVGASLWDKILVKKCKKC